MKYTDITNDMLLDLNILFSGRGMGKTFSILKHRIEDADLDDLNKSKFIWLRDSAEVVKKIAAGNSLAAPIKKVYPEFPEVKIVKSEGNYHFMKDANTDNYKSLGYLMALSTFHNARGVSYDDVINITWDEFIPEEGAVIKKYQGLTFLNAYETVNRNRELEGRPPVKIIFITNTNGDIYSEVLEDLGVSGIVEDMVHDKIRTYRDQDTWIEFLENKDFTEAKEKTFLYRHAKNAKFTNMALYNEFSYNDALIKRKCDLKASTALLTLDNKYTLIQLKDKSLFWKLGAWKGCINYDMDNDQEALLFRLLFTDKYRLAYIAGNMYFDSVYTQRAILNYARF